MDIWRCSECFELMIASLYPAKGWRFNGDCYQHNCEAMRKELEEMGMIPSNNYQYASEHVSGDDILSIIEQLQSKIQALEEELEKVEDKNREMQMAGETLQLECNDLQAQLDNVKKERDELKPALKNLIFTATKLWDEVKSIKNSDTLTVSHPIIEQAKQTLKGGE